MAAYPDRPELEYNEFHDLISIWSIDLSGNLDFELYKQIKRFAWEIGWENTERD